MSDRAALLAAIRMHPDEDTPRLVFADWLDEHGESERAEFIRLQCDPGYVQDWRTGDAPAPLTPEQKGHRFACPDFHMVGYDKGDWVVYTHKSSHPTVKRFDVKFARGFVDSVRCAASEWLAHADAILAEHPVRRVALSSHWTWDDFDSVPGDDGTRVCTFTLSAGGEQFRLVRRIALEDMRAKYNAELVWPGIEFELPPAPALNAADWLADTSPAMPYTLTGTSS